MKAFIEKVILEDWVRFGHLIKGRGCYKQTKHQGQKYQRYRENGAVFSLWQVYCHIH